MSSSDTSMPAPRHSPVMKIVAAVAAVAMLAFGASAVARHGSSPSAAQGAPQGFSPQGRAARAGAVPGPANCLLGRGWSARRAVKNGRLG